MSAAPLLSVSDLVAVLAVPGDVSEVATDGGRRLIVVDLETASPHDTLEVPVHFPAVIVGVGSPLGPGAALADGMDLAITPEAAPDHGAWVATTDPSSELDRLDEAVSAHPIASLVLTQLLRAGRGLNVPQGLIAESLAYSTLQSGPEFVRWLAGRQPRQPKQSRSDVLLVFREGSTLSIVLNRPEVHNAYNSALRELLCDALTGALADATIERIVLRGLGPSFCSGGDLDEFGTFADPASAHLIRTVRSPGLLIHRMAGRVEAHVHGSCVGSGIELPAFAGRVEADPGTRFSLPEVAMGLIPGAGGTVSLTSRIGRQRVAWMGLTGSVIGAETARRWGLVDAIGDLRPYQHNR